MELLYSIFFGAGVAGFAYVKLGRRVGYGNSSSVWMLVGIFFILGFVFFYTFTTRIVHLQ